MPAVPADLDTSQSAGTNGGGSGHVTNLTETQQAIHELARATLELKQAREELQHVHRAHILSDAAPALISRLRHAADAIQGPPPIETPIPPGSPGPIFTGDPLYLTYQLDQVAISGSSGGLPGGWIDVTQSPYNADPTGATDSTSAFNSLSTFLSANGGTFYIPPGTYTISGVWSCDQNVFAYNIIGCGGGKSGKPASIVKFTGAGAVNGLTLNSSFGILIAFIRFTYTQLTGNVIQLSGAVHAQDTQDCQIYRCNFDGPATPTANSCITFEETDNSLVESCQIQGAINGIVWGPDFVNVCQILRNVFTECTTCFIFLSSNDCEACVIGENTFEPIGSPIPSSAILGSSSVFTGGGPAPLSLTIRNNWFADVSASIIWINKLTTWSGIKTCTLQGNYFGGLSGGDACCFLRGSWLSISNTFDGSPAFDSDLYTAFRLMTIGDAHTGVANLFPGASRPAVYVNLSLDAVVANGQLPYGNPSLTTVVGNVVDVTNNANNIPPAPTIYTNTNAKTVTIHPQSAGAQYIYPVPVFLPIANCAANNLTVAAAVGVTLSTPGGAVLTPGQGGMLIQTSQDNWMMVIQ